MIHGNLMVCRVARPLCIVYTLPLIRKRSVVEFYIKQEGFPAWTNAMKMDNHTQEPQTIKGTLEELLNSLSESESEL